MKQSIVARSTKTEYRALTHGICEGMWLNRLRTELKLEDGYPFKMTCENQAAMSIAKNPVHHDRTKHIEVARHFISEKIEKTVIDLNYIPFHLETLHTPQASICHVVVCTW